LEKSILESNIPDFGTGLTELAKEREKRELSDNKILVKNLYNKYLKKAQEMLDENKPRAESSFEAVDVREEIAICAEKQNSIHLGAIHRSYTTPGTLGNGVTSPRYSACVSQQTILSRPIPPPAVGFSLPSLARSSTSL
jgi:hypothetical protein